MKGMSVAIVAGVMLLGGCATKRYVADRVDSVNGKVGEVDEKQQNTQKQLDQAETKISAADEKASSADARAGDAIGRADAASKKSDQVKDELRGELNDRIANLDDYKSAGDVTVLFKFNSAELTSDGKQQLDQLVTSQVGSLRRYFIAIQGFTDKVGAAEYNLNLSRRCAEAVFESSLSFNFAIAKSCRLNQLARKPTGGRFPAITRCRSQNKNGFSSKTEVRRTRWALLSTIAPARAAAN